MAIRKRTGKRGVTWQIDYTDPTGKRVRQTFKLKKDAVNELAKRVSLIGEGRYLDVKKTCEVTLGEMIGIYTQEYEDQPSFYRAKAFWLDNFKTYFGENTLLDQVPYAKVKEYRQHLKRKATRRGGIRKEGSINKEMSCLRHLFREAVERDIIESSPFANKKTLCLKENNKKTRYLAQEEIDRLLATTMPEWCKDVIEAILLTGMRRQEAIGLKWQHVSNGLLYLGKTKTGVPRWLPINKDLEDHLKAVRKKHGLTSQYVFCDPRGRKVKGNSFSWAVASAMKRANIDASRPVHTLRHTFASHFVMRGGDLPSLKEILGHEKIEMTMRYAHLAPKYLQDSINKMNGLTTKKCDENVTSMVSKPSIESIASNG